MMPPTLRRNGGDRSKDQAQRYDVEKSTLKILWYLAIQWLGGSDKWSVWGTHIPYVFGTPIQWGAGWSYLEFPKHLIAGHHDTPGATSQHRDPATAWRKGLQW